MFERRSEKLDMHLVHKCCIPIVCILLIYDYFYSTQTITIRVNFPSFSVLGPYNRTITSQNISDNYTQLIDLKNFAFKINPQPCFNYQEGLLLVVMVTSNPSNYDKRTTIRTTWGQPINSTKLVFLMGDVVDPTLTMQIQNESKKYGDIVQGTFIDAYRNMTYKHVMGLKWVSHHCPMAKYVLKTDDDVLVNSHELIHFLARELSPWGSSNLIVCQAIKRAAVQRSQDSKWKVSDLEYANTFYPTYCPGWVIIYSQDVVLKLLIAAQSAQYFWIDDVHITGIIAEQIGISRTSLDQLILSPLRVKILTHWGRKYAGQFLFGPPDITVDTINKIWNAII